MIIFDDESCHSLLFKNDCYQLNVCTNDFFYYFGFVSTFTWHQLFVNDRESKQSSDAFIISLSNILYILILCSIN